MVRGWGGRGGAVGGGRGRERGGQQGCYIHTMFTQAFINAGLMGTSVIYFTFTRTCTPSYAPPKAAPLQRSTPHCITLFCCPPGSLSPAPALLETRSLTVLTPMYGEDVLYSIDGSETAIRLMGTMLPAGPGWGGAAGSGADAAAAGRALPNLLLPALVGGGGGDGGGSSSERLSLLTFLRNMHPSEWDNFCERVARLANAAAAAAAGPLATVTCTACTGVSERDFLCGGPLAPWAMELQLWASCRAQVRSVTMLLWWR